MKKERKEKREQRVMEIVEEWRDGSDIELDIDGILESMMGRNSSWPGCAWRGARRRARKGVEVRNRRW